MRYTSPPRIKSTLCVIALLTACQGAGGPNVYNDPARPQTLAPTQSGPVAPTNQPADTVWGVTTDTVPYVGKEPEAYKFFFSSLDSIRRVRRPMIRVIIDKHKADEKLPYKDAGQYQKAIQGMLDFYKAELPKIRERADVMLMLADSYYMYPYKNSDAYGQKARVYVKELKGLVDVWEIGNEVNGEWVGWKEKEWRGKSDAELEEERKNVAAQISAAYEEVKLEGGKVALTLYYNDNKRGSKCWDKPAYEMSAWADTHLRGYKDKLDYVFISFYQDDCPGVLSGVAEKDIEMWVGLFDSLLARFGDKTMVGFGEVSPQCKYKECGYDVKKDDLKKVNRTCPRCEADQKEFIERYYKTYHAGVKSKVPQYVGGYFYWYFYKDMVLSSKKPALGHLVKAIE